MKIGVQTFGKVCMCHVKIGYCTIPKIGMDHILTNKKWLKSHWQNTQCYIRVNLRQSKKVMFCSLFDNF